ncbi:MAG TPA: galactose-1-phosphate uridylyltransferase [Candidatus Binatia bacterium]
MSSPIIMSEFRQDPITGRWVIIASERSKRPRHDGRRDDQSHSLPCPFCAGNETMTPPEIWAHRENNTQADTPGWSVRVVPNKYPALESGGRWSAGDDSLYRSQAGFGTHEVIIESPDHVVDMGALSAEQFTKILRAYHRRTRELQTDPRWRYLLLYKNHGARAGATLEHIHSQLIALPAVPKEAADELNGAKKHFQSTGRCIYCEIIQREGERHERLVSQSEHFIAVCPFAPRFGYETWLLPKNHVAAFEQSREEDVTALAHALSDLVSRLNRALNNPPFNYVIHSSPPQQTALPYYHWHIEIMPQLTRAAGFEWGSGVYMNSITPEDAARFLRDAAPG